MTGSDAVNMVKMKTWIKTRACHSYWTVFILWCSFIVFTVWFSSFYLSVCSPLFACVSFSLPATVF